MANEGQKKVYERPVIVFFLTFAGLAGILTILAVLDEKNLPFVVGFYYFYGGMIVATIGFLFLNKGGILYRTNTEYFKKKRAEEKPIERIVWPVIFAAISITAIGYVLNSLLLK